MKNITHLLLSGLIVILSLPTVSYSQASPQPANNAQQIQVLQAKLDSMSQYFKQREDFKREIEKEASAQVDGVVNRWLRTWGLFYSALLFLLGFFGIKEIHKFLLEHIDSKVRQTMLENYDKITLEQTKFMVRFETENYKNNSKDELPLGEAKKLVERAKKTGDEKLTGKVLDNLISAYFNRVDFKNLSSLVLTYERDVQSPVSWANAAIANMDQYELHNAKQYRDFSLKAASCALDLMPDYGEPQAVKLMIEMIDYDRTQDEEKKEQIVKEAKEIIDTVNKATSIITSYETFNYLEKCGNNENFRSYYLHLFDCLPNEMNEMQKRFIMHDKKINPYRKEEPNTSEKTLSGV